MKNKVYITSAGIISALGCDLKTFSANLFAGKSCGRSLHEIFHTNFPVPYAALIEDPQIFQLDSLPKDTLAKYLPLKHREDIARSWFFTLACLNQIVEKGSLRRTPIDGVILGTPEGVGHEVVDHFLSQKLDSSPDLRSLSSETTLEDIREVLSQLYGHEIADENLIPLNAACATGNQSIGMAMESIQAGQWQSAIVGGVDARCTRSNILNFNMLSALATADRPAEEASRPFDAKRDGFVRGEGAGLLLLESESSLKKSGNTPLAEVCGYGTTSDAYRVTDPREDGECLISAMKQAIASAGLTSNDIDYINAHGTSTLLNDKTETLAIKKLFGDKAYKTPISSLKSQIGHSTVAAGAIETIACVEMLQKQMISPTINYQFPDEDCDLDYVPNTAREVSLTTILNNNLGFGGQNICLVLRKVQ